ncbi:MAG: DUF4837 family protein [Salibacteraceae bacterium]
MKSFAKFLGIGLVGILFLNSCEDKSTFKPGYAGSFGELIVVVSDNLWKTDLGDTIYESLGAYQYGFPQDERQFNIIQVTPQKFKNVLRTHRNVCIVKIDSNATKPIVLQKGKWANGQIVVTLSARSYNSLFEVVKNHVSRAADIFKQSEINRHYKRNLKFGNAELNKEIEKTRGFKMVTQKDVYLEKNDSSVTWIRLERERPKGGFKHQISQGVLTFSLPYTDKMNFLDTNIYQTVDSVFKEHLLGPGPGQHMRLNFRYIEPLGKEVNFKNSFAKEYRGLWRMQGNAMGGPMYLLVFLDEVNARVVYSFGYVFAPQFDKREYLREVEGMIQSIEVPKV